MPSSENIIANQTIMNDLVSVIIPCFNSSNHIKKAVENILSQSYTKLECLLVDDGSTDGSQAICEKLAQNDTRVRFLPKKHEGVAAARNHGILHANGGWIQQMDVDDQLHPDKISLHMKQLSSLDQSKNIIFYTDWDIVWENKNQQIVQGDTITVGNKTKAELLEQLVRWNFLPNSPLSNNTIFCKRSVFDLKMYDESLGAFEDFDLFTSLLLADTEFVYTPVVGMSYLQHTTNMTSNKNKMIRNYVRYLEALNEKNPDLLKHCQSIGNLLCETLVNGDKESFYRLLQLIEKTDVPVYFCNKLNLRNINAFKVIYFVRSILPVSTTKLVYKELKRLPKRVRWHLKHRLGI